jgi:type IV secretory pathway VirD2 relaxase
MKRDDEFTPKLGRIRSRGSRRGQRYLGQVVRAISRAGGSPRGYGREHGGFTGARIGRGAGIGRVLRTRDRYAGFRARRVVIKTRIVKLAGHSLKAAQLHLRYIQRDGVTREGLPGELYDNEHDRADGQALLDRSVDDRHQFRFIVAAEDAVEVEDLKGFTRRLMAQVEKDLGTRLEWVAVDHYNTGHPHTHVVVRGKDERGKDLIIAREYIAHGMRERAAELMTLDLGPRTDLEIENRLRSEIDQDRFTTLDRGLIRAVDEEGRLDPRGRPVGSERVQQTLRAGRLQTLRRLGLAAEESPGLWRLSPEMEPTLRRMGERGDVIKTMHRALAAEGRERAAGEYTIYDAADPHAGRIVGRVIERGLADEFGERHYLVLDGIDGRTHYVDAGAANTLEPTPTGAIVAINASQGELRPADRIIAEIAAANSGRYNADLHAQYDPVARAPYIEAHVRRLEALRRLGLVQRERDGSWRVPENFVARAQAAERGRTPVQLQVLSVLPLAQQIGADGATWLDHQIADAGAEAIREAGFGREVRAALAQRRLWLVEQGLAERHEDQIVCRRNLLALLRKRELDRVGAQLTGELGRPYAEAQPGQSIEGSYRRRVDLATGRFALIENAREFTLVPWRPVLDRHVGKSVNGIMRGETISWTIGRRRGPSISQ